jgi:glycosidase
MRGRRWRGLPQLAACFLILSILAGCAAGPTPAPTSASAPAAIEPATSTPAATAAPAATPTIAPTVAPTESPADAQYGWWNDRIFYEIFVRSFQDSDADGVGDLKGLISRLDYLNDGNPDTTDDLGVTGIWLMPVAESPSYHGYDVVDYMTIDEEYGTRDDFDRLLEEAHKRGIKVIVDLVMNHTSSQHPWFLEAQDPNSPKHDWYVWSENPTGPGWHKADNGLQYYGFFSPDMPDLNYANPEVTEAMREIIRFWLEDVKVDGFRLDAIKHLFEEGRKVEHAPATFEWLQDFYKFYKGVNPEAFTVGESWGETSIVAKYVPDKVDTAFEFTMAEAMIQSALQEDREFVERAQPRVDEVYPPGQFASFLANHDQNRTRSRMLEEGQAYTAASLQLLYPGVPFVYYGEEIGMQGQKPDENIRRPMQWTADGGFTDGEPWNSYFDDVAERNVEGQAADPASLLNHYRGLIRLRNTYPALRTGDWRLVTVPEEAKSVYSFVRSQGDERFLVLINLDDKPVSDYELSLEPLPGAAASARPVTAELVFGPEDAAGEIPIIPTDGFEGYKPIAELPPYSTFVIRFAQ